jgi:hypothetical protein
MGRIPGRGVQRALDHLSHLRIGDRARAAGAVLVGKPFDPICHEPPAPLADRVLVYPKALGDFLALQAIRTQQDHSAAVRQGTGRLVPANLRVEKGPLLGTQNHRISQPARHRTTSHKQIRINERDYGSR